QPINISLPIKMAFEVVESPPGIKGNTADGGNKQVVIETGAKINTPLFIKQGDIIQVNTETKEYAGKYNGQTEDSKHQTPNYKSQFSKL
ncbi:MAG: hypothetical protein KAQ63_02480, partial [Candidatus Moranbacteria bacterium]|nr:hypothetical protein [Candidatus Moranbacteria bacterium]